MKSAAEHAHWRAQVEAAVQRALDRQYRRAFGRTLTAAADLVDDDPDLEDDEDEQRRLKLAGLPFDPTTWDDDVDAEVGPVANQAVEHARAAVLAALPAAIAAAVGTIGVGDTWPARIVDGARRLGYGLADRIAALSPNDPAYTDKISAAYEGSMGQAANVGSMATHAGNAVVAEATDAASQQGFSLEKTWNTVGDENVRDSHADAEGQTVDASDLFSVGDDLLAFPGDPGGSAEETFGCFPGETIVVARHVELGYRRPYTGQMVTLRTAGGHELAGTPNHPVLTVYGFRPLGDLQEGDHVVGSWLAEREPIGDPDVQHGPASLGEIVGSLGPPEDTKRIVVHPHDFHGDGTQGHVDVVRPDRPLLLDAHAPSPQPAGYLGLALADPPPRTLSGTRLAATADDVRIGPPSWRRRMRRLYEVCAFIGRGAAHPDRHGGTPTSRLDAPGEQASPDSVSSDAETVGDRQFTVAGEVTLDEVVSVERHAFSGHVFNLQTRSGWYEANGFYARNCRCWLTFAGYGQEGEIPEDQLPGEAMGESTGE